MTGAPEPTGDADRPRRWRRARWLGGGALIVGAGLILAYGVRTQLADALVSRQLSATNVDASYQIDQISVTHQRLTNVRIGDPARPDLTAREVDVWLGYGWEGPRIDRIRLRGVHVRGRYDGERLRLGQLDRLLPSPTDEPLELPDISLDVADAGAVIDTPWGRVAAGAVLNGNPLRLMSGAVAVRSHALALAGCTLGATQMRANVRSDGADLRLVGPVSAARADCPGQRASGRGILANANMTVPISLDSVQWTGDFSATSVIGADISLSRLSGRSTGRWARSQNRVSGLVSARASDVTGASLIARGGAFRGDFAHVDGRWRFNGGTALTGATLPRQWQGLGRQLAGQNNAPILGPLLANLGEAIDRAGRAFRISAPIRIDSSADMTRLSVASAQLRSDSGAALALNGDDRLLSWDGRRLALGGNFELDGGGFPALSGTLVRTNGSGLVLTMRPFRAAALDAALAVDRLELAMDPNGNGRFTVAAGLSGPIAGGRVDGLALPLSGQISNGRVSIDAGCRDVRYAGLAMATIRFGPGALRACSLPGEPLLAFGNGGLRGGLSSGPITLRGRSGATLWTLGAAGLRYSLSGGTAEVRGLTVELGQGAATTRFAADQVTGHSDAQGWQGALVGGSGRIGTVPLAMSAIAGPWRWVNGALILNGGMMVTDTAAPERFTPMSVTGAALRYAENRIMATGVVGNPESPNPLANLTLEHRFADTAGEAAFTLIPIRFATDGLQPQQLTELAKGVVANVNATVTGRGRIAWTVDGVTSTGSFSTDDAELAAAFGPVAGLSGTINFDDLLSLTTPPGQTVRLGSVNPGIEVVDGSVSYQMLLNNRVRIEGGQWPFAGGTLRLLPGLIDYAADQPRYLSFDVEGIDAARFLERYGFQNITATGVFDGVIPTIFDGNGGRVVGGSLVVRDGGGSLAYVGELSTQDLGYFGNLAFGALRSVEYDALVIRLNGNIDGEMLTEVSFTGLGQGPGATNNFLTRQIARLPFAFNIRINAPFRQLLTSARSLYDPTILIDQNLPALLRAQREAERAGQPPPEPTPPNPPVQQEESGNPPQRRQE